LLARKPLASAHESRRQPELREERDYSCVSIAENVIGLGIQRYFDRYHA